MAELDWSIYDTFHLNPVDTIDAYPKLHSASSPSQEDMKRYKKHMEAFKAKQKPLLDEVNKR